MARWQGASPNGHTYTIEQEMIPVPSLLPVADEHWRYTDAAGHEHYYDRNATRPADRYPTLAWWAEDYIDCDDGDMIPIGHYECAWCDEVIAPGTRDGSMDTIPGMTTYLRDGEPITKEQFEADMAVMY